MLPTLFPPSMCLFAQLPRWAFFCLFILNFYQCVLIFWYGDEWHEQADGWLFHPICLLSRIDKLPPLALDPIQLHFWVKIMDKLVADASIKNTISYYEDRLNKLGISKEEMSRLLQSDEARWKERTTFPAVSILLVAGVVSVVLGAVVGIG